MSILAEPRRKRKICADPQNMTWKKDTNKFGHKMLEKMGWSDGQGLGINNQGLTENIKLNANYTQKGIGAEANNADRTWIAHHDEFSFLLEKLNEKKAAKSEKEEVQESSDSEDEEAPKSKKICEVNSKSLEERSKSTKSRIHYKFTKMKDLSRYSDKDKSAVIGVGLKSKSKEEAKEKTPEKSLKPVDELATVKNSGVSLNDYFATKMAKFYAKKTKVNEALSVVEIKEDIVEQIEIVNEEHDEESELRSRKAEKKALKQAKREAEALAEIQKSVQIEELIQEDGEEENRVRRKTERKERKRKEREAQTTAAEKAE